MLRYRDAIFRRERAARAVAAALLTFCCLLTAQGAAAQARASAVVPADGRLNMPDFSAKVTSVAWPARNDGQEPTPGRRFVRFTLEVTSIGQPLSPTGPLPSLNAVLRWDDTSHPLPLSTIDDELARVFSSAQSAKASASYMADVPTNTHDVELVLSEGTFSQSFDLWTLRRIPPAPAVLYRDPTQTSLSAAAAGPTALSLSNPADGFAGSASVTLQSATLGFFAPGTTLSPSPDQAVLSVVLDGNHPEDPNDLTSSGHYLGSEVPLPAAMLSFTPTGADAVPATISDAGSTEGQGNADAGLFDATYSFLVPATLTSGVLQVAAGPFTGAEFTLYTAESGTTTLDVTAPATLVLSFPAPVAEAAQKTPPWVGQPDPPTSAAPANALVSHSSSPSHGPPGFPVWVAIGLLLLAALAAVLYERWRRSRRLATASATASAESVVVDPPPAAPRAHVVASEPGDTEVTETEPEITSVSDDIEGPSLEVMGPEEVIGLRKPIEPRVLDVFRYLAFHKHRHLRAGQILIGMWPSGSKGADLTEKTIRNYIGALRVALGIEHLPEASAKAGYILLDVTTDWDRFEAQARRADVVGGEAADHLRDRALRLVRGVPFCDRTDEWIGAEGLANHICEAIAVLALRLSQDRYLGGDFFGAQDAARRGIVGAPEDCSLWEAGAVAIDARGDTTALRRWMADAAHHLEPAEIARIETTLRGLHGDSPQS